MKTNEISYIDTYNFKKLMNVTQLVTGSTFIPESASFFIKNISSGSIYYVNEMEIHNVSTSATGSIRIFYNSSGSITSSIYQQIAYLSISPSETFWLTSTYPYVLNYGDFLSGIANTASVNILVKGTII